MIVKPCEKISSFSYFNYMSSINRQSQFNTKKVTFHNSLFYMLTVGKQDPPWNSK